MIEVSVSADGVYRSTPNSSRSETIHRSVVQPLAQLVPTGRRWRFLDRIREDERGDLAVADLDCDYSVETPGPAPASPCQPSTRAISDIGTPSHFRSRRISAQSANDQHFLPPWLDSRQRQAEAGQDSRSVVSIQLPSTRVTASVLGVALGMVGRPVSTGLHNPCRLSSFLTRWQREGE
jgi:hypothetical protein